MNLTTERALQQDLAPGAMQALTLEPRLKACDAQIRQTGRERPSRSPFDRVRKLGEAGLVERHSQRQGSRIE